MGKIVKDKWSQGNWTQQNESKKGAVGKVWYMINKDKEPKYTPPGTVPQPIKFLADIGNKGVDTAAKGIVKILRAVQPGKTAASDYAKKMLDEYIKEYNKLAPKDEKINDIRDALYLMPAYNKKIDDYTDKEKLEYLKERYPLSKWKEKSNITPKE